MPPYATAEAGLRLVLAALLAGLIGWERESHHRPAGLRTHILVGVGSTLLTLVSQDFYRVYCCRAPVDPGRIAAQIVSGIGFLGAGTILREGPLVRGLTTAASLWVAAAIGIAVGAGSYQGALITTAVTLVALVFLGRLERRWHGGKRPSRLELQVADRPGQLAAVSAALARHQVDIRDVQLVPAEGGTVQLELLVVVPPGVDRGGLLREVASLDGVRAVRLQE